MSGSPTAAAWMEPRQFSRNIIPLLSLPLSNEENVDALALTDITNKAPWVSKASGCVGLRGTLSPERKTGESASRRAAVILTVNTTTLPAEAD